MKYKKPQVGMDRREEFFLRFPLIISYVELRFSELEQIAVNLSMCYTV